MCQSLFFGFGFLFPVSFDGRVWFVVMFKRKAFFSYGHGERRRIFLFFYIFFIFGIVEAQIFKRMLFFAAVALFKDLSSLFLFSLSFLFVSSVRAIGPAQFDDVPLDVFCV